MSRLASPFEGSLLLDALHAYLADKQMLARLSPKQREQLLTQTDDALTALQNSAINDNYKILCASLITKMIQEFLKPTE